MLQQRVQAKVILLNAENKILLLKRSQYSDRRAGEWELVGGGVDIGESPEQAAAREILEETGLMVPITTQDLVFAQTRIPQDTGINVTWITYMGHATSDTVQLSDEHTEYRWVAPDEALKVITYDIQLNALQHVIQNGLI